MGSDTVSVSLQWRKNNPLNMFANVGQHVLLAFILTMADEMQIYLNINYTEYWVNVNINQQDQNTWTLCTQLVVTFFWLPVAADMR